MGTQKKHRHGQHRRQEKGEKQESTTKNRPMTDKHAETTAWVNGWIWHRTGNQPREHRPPADTEAGIEWMKGYCTALADYPNEQPDSIEQSLQNEGITGEGLRHCLEWGALALQNTEWNRWPSLPLYQRDALTFQKPSFDLDLESYPES